VRRMLEDRHIYLPPEQVWEAAARHLQDSGCTEYLRYDDIPQDRMEKLLKSLHRSHQINIRASILYTGERNSTQRVRHFFLTPEAAALVQEKLADTYGPPAAEGIATATQITQILGMEYTGPCGR